jgi:Flp pilus assembly protein TadG
MSRTRSASGQATIMTVLFLVVLLALAAAVIDVGAWFRADRRLQAAADASVLAAAQGLPNTGTAATLAAQYAAKNGETLGAGGVTFSTSKSANDTVTVKFQRTAPTTFTKLLGVGSVTLHASASARYSMLASVKGISPIAVSEQHTMLQCSGGPCYGQATKLSYHHPGSAPKDPLTSVYVNLIADQQAKITETLIAQWIRDGFQVEKTTGVYAAFGDPTYLSPEVKAALESRFGNVIIVPVIRTFNKNLYSIVSFAAFKITGLGKITEHHWEIYGSFVQTTAEGSPPSGTTTQPNYGVGVISLVD